MIQMKAQPLTRKSRFTVCFTGLLLCTIGLCLNRAHAWQSDNSNETFNNPVLYASYPDPDIIRVSNDFYMATTTLNDSAVMKNHRGLGTMSTAAGISQ